MVEQESNNLSEEFLYLGAPELYLGVTTNELNRLKRSSGIKLSPLIQNGLRGFSQIQLDALAEFKAKSSSPAQTVTNELSPIELTQEIPLEMQTTGELKDAAMEFLGLNTRQGLAALIRRYQQTEQAPIEVDYSVEFLERLKEFMREEQIGKEEFARLEVEKRQEREKERAQIIEKKNEERKRRLEVRNQQRRDAKAREEVIRTQKVEAARQREIRRKEIFERRSRGQMKPRKIISENTMNARVDELLSSGAPAIEMYFAEIKHITHPERSEQFELGRQVQEAKLNLFALRELETDSLPIYAQEEIKNTLENQKAKTLLRYFASKGAKPTENEEDIIEGEEIEESDSSKSEAEIKPLRQVALERSEDLKAKIEAILDIEISEDRENELRKLLDEVEGEIEDGLQAHERLVVSNSKLVTSIAHRYKRDQWGVEELIGEGSMGLIIAASYYDYRRGLAFSTYATNWIKQAIMRGIADQSRMIRLPVHVHEDMSRIQKGKNTMSASKELIEKAQAVQSLLSLDKPIGPESESTLGDFIVDPNSGYHENDAVVKDVKAHVRAVLELLPTNERFVLQRRFGVDGSGQEPTLEEVGKEMGVTRERVRQIEKRALRRLNEPRFKARLEGLL